MISFEAVSMSYLLVKGGEDRTLSYPIRAGGRGGGGAADLLSKTRLDDDLDRLRTSTTK